MKKIDLLKIFTILMVLCTGLNSCEDDDKGQVMALTLLEAVMDGTNNNTMTISLKDNTTLQLTPFIMPQSAANKNVTYSNLHAEVLTVSESGLITPHMPGTDTLTVSATDGSGVRTSYLVRIIDHKVKATAINVTAEGSNMSLKVGDTPFNLAAQVTLSPEDTWDTSLSYTSADESIVTVSADGMVTPVGVGSTTITIKTLDGSNLSRDCNVTVLSQAPTNHDRTGWTAKTAVEIEGVAGGFTYTPANISWIPDRISQGGVTNSTLTGMPEHLFDDKSTTFLALLKPSRKGPYNTGSNWDVNQEATKQLLALLGGATQASATVETTAVNYFVVDMQSAIPFSYIRWTHRNASRNLQVHSVDIYGSNDGTNWGTKLNGSTPLALPEVTGDQTIWITEDHDEFNYRYVKVVIVDYDQVNSYNVQIGEFGLGYLK